jgi:hypothetical protein
MRSSTSFCRPAFIILWQFCTFCNRMMDGPDNAFICMACCNFVVKHVPRNVSNDSLSQNGTNKHNAAYANFSDAAFDTNVSEKMLPPKMDAHGKS